MPSVKSYQNRKAEIARLEIERQGLVSEIVYERGRAKLLAEMVRKFIEREAELKKQIETSELKIRILRDYVRTTPIGRLLMPLPVEDVPSCLKPLDAIKYSSERIDNGPDNLPQQLP